VETEEKLTFYLVRHGQYDPARATDWRGGGLTDLGWRQAELTAARLGRLPIRRIYYSTLLRATQTASAVMQFFPDLKAKPSRLLWELVPPFAQADAHHFARNSPAELAESAQRAETAWQRFFVGRVQRGGDTLMVAHGNIIRYFACRALGVDPTVWLRAETHNCGLTILAYEDGFWRLVSLNDTGHLPEKMKTFV
jgi:serine/threonine-protein phosphatase PGAM5